MSMIRKYKLTVYSADLTIGEGSYFSSADAWIELNKLSEKDIIAVPMGFRTQEPIFINEIKVKKAYMKEFGEISHEMPIEYWAPIMIGLTGDDYIVRKEISIDFSNQSCKNVSDPNSFLYIPNKNYR